MTNCFVTFQIADEDDVISSKISKQNVSCSELWKITLKCLIQSKITTFIVVEFKYFHPKPPLNIKPILGDNEQSFSPLYEKPLPNGIYFYTDLTFYGLTLHWTCEKKNTLKTICTLNEHQWYSGYL